MTYISMIILFGKSINLKVFFFFFFFIKKKKPSKFDKPQFVAIITHNAEAKLNW